jgi:galactokinase
METFAALFGHEPEAAGSAPGRVNMLGEHTDYNDGFVLPAAIPQTTTVEVARSRSGEMTLHSTSERAHQPIVSYRPNGPPPEGFARYIDGCFKALRERGIEAPPIAALIRSTVPIGAGLSSSAALEVALLRALRSLLALPLDDVEIARLAQRAESHYVGVRCGIMDQMASSLADSSSMLFLDTRSLERRLVPFPPGTRAIVLHSGVPRSLAASGYNDRRRECEAAARALGVASLRDVTDLDAARTLPTPLDRRARHVISENARVVEAAGGVSARRFGALMSASHASLRDDYDVSVPALDALVECLEAQPGVHGARLTGAGFGGACVALVDAPRADAAKEGALRAFAKRGFRGEPLV